MAKKEKKGPGLWAEFKEFINRGNAFMLAVGVVIGGAFSAIVSSRETAGDPRSGNGRKRLSGIHRG